ncbi:predicted protein [Histoplasma capsulatum H143]|uniref:Uncharacterized protein n=1 Tax=Ajellomyces capsulatus (strain H143) TaxID=544712 RepID=C6H5H6_AJECH|nr:predicted protein [Histoplasma capsulatum H143]
MLRDRQMHKEDIPTSFALVYCETEATCPLQLKKVHTTLKRSWSLKDPQSFLSFAMTPPFTASSFNPLRRLGGVLLPIMRFTHIPRRAYRISGKDEILGGRTNKLLPICHRACEGLLGP